MWLIYRLRLRSPAGVLRWYVGSFKVPGRFVALGWPGAGVEAALAWRADAHLNGIAKAAWWCRGCELVEAIAVDWVDERQPLQEMRLALRSELIAALRDRREHGNDSRGGAFCSYDPCDTELAQLAELLKWSATKLRTTVPYHFPAIARRHLLGLCFRCGGGENPPDHWASRCPLRCVRLAASEREEACNPNPAPLPLPAPQPKPKVRAKAAPAKAKAAPAKAKAAAAPKVDVPARALTGCGRASVGTGQRSPAGGKPRAGGVYWHSDERPGRGPPYYYWTEPGGGRAKLFVERQPSGGYLVHGTEDVAALFDPLEFEAARDAAGRLGEEFARGAGCSAKRSYKRARVEETA